MQHRGGPRLLATDRTGAVYLERARIHVEGGRVVYHIVDDEHRREYNIPHVNVAVLFIGQGTSITQDAMRLLGEEGVHLAVTGTGGTPLHLGALTTYVGTEQFRRLLPIYLSIPGSLAAAKAVMAHRTERMAGVGSKLTTRHLRSELPTGIRAAGAQFAERLTRCGAIDEMLGYEGNYTKACYREFSRSAGLGDEFRRSAGVEDDTAKPSVAQVNRLVDHGNYLCYGMAGAALWLLGIPPHMSVFHGKTRAGGLVFDVADSFKDAFVLPIAFAVASGIDRQTGDPEQTFRAMLISAFDDHKVLGLAIDTIVSMIDQGGKVSAADA